MKQIININSHRILFALTFSMGLGMFKVSLLLLIAALVAVRGQYRKIFGRIKLGGWVLIFFSLLFLCTYSIEYVPYRPEKFSIETYYFQMLFVLSFCALALPFCFQDEKNYPGLIWCLCLGAFSWAIVTILASLLFSSPPYYSRILDLRALARGVIQYGNTPGIASLLTFLPIVFFANLIGPRLWSWSRYWHVSLLIAIATLMAGLLIQQRSFFVIALIIQPALVCVLALIQKKLKLGLILLATLISYPLLLVANIHFGFLSRKLDGGIFFDARIQMFKSWLEQIASNPFLTTIVGPSPWDTLPHFHNFFADVHRISGFWALCFAIILIGYIFIRLMYLTYFNRQIGCYLLSMAFPILLIMLSSVVPEGEKQPFLALLLIGAIAERCISGMPKPLDLG